MIVSWLLGSSWLMAFVVAHGFHDLPWLMAFVVANGWWLLWFVLADGFHRGWWQHGGCVLSLLVAAGFCHCWLDVVHLLLLLLAVVVASLLCPYLHQKWLTPSQATVHQTNPLAGWLCCILSKMSSSNSIGMFERYEMFEPVTNVWTKEVQGLYLPADVVSEQDRHQQYYYTIYVFSATSGLHSEQNRQQSTVLLWIFGASGFASNLLWLTANLLSLVPDQILYIIVCLVLTERLKRGKFEGG